MLTRRALMLFALVALTGCLAQLGSGSDDDYDPSLSAIGNSVVATLRTKHAAGKGHTWQVSTDAALQPGWIVQTPPVEYWGQPASALPVAMPCTGDAACDPDFGLIRCTTQADCRFGGRCTEVGSTVTRPGETPRRMCTGHSDGFNDEIYNLIVSAQQFADIASLEPPDGRFEAAMRNAFTYLSHTGRAIKIRVLYGAEPLRALETSDVLASLTRDIDTTAPLRIRIGDYRTSVVSWNHTKSISADGRVALVGGHNMWTQHYLQQSPVHDLSMLVTGSAAADATRFVDELWKLVCTPGADLTAKASTSDYPAGTHDCYEAYSGALDLALAAGSGHTPVVTVGKIGGRDGDEGEDAILALLGAAQKSLRLSLQDIGPIAHGPDWPEVYLRAIDQALVRGVDIQLVLTNLNALPGGLTVGSASYSNGWTPMDVARKLVEYGDAHPDAIGGADLRKLICTNLHATTLRQGPDDVWPDGAGIANHAKLVVADDAAFYLGSQNWYPAQLSEMGYVVDDAGATAELLDQYFFKVWNLSTRVMANTCAL